MFFILAASFPAFSVSAQEYFFQEEFNNNRSNNILDSNKWVVYPNTASNFITIKEVNGFVNVTSDKNNVFPYVVSKQNPFPLNGDFEAEIGFYYTFVAVRGTGIVLSINPPSNNIPEIDKNKPEVYFFGTWQGLDEGLNVTYNGYCALGLSCNNPGTTIYKFPAPNLSFHKVRLIYSGNVYIVYVDDKKVFTSPLSLNRPKYIWLGNPTNQGFNDYWTAFRVDYIKVKQLFPETFLDLPWDYGKKGIKF